MARLVPHVVTRVGRIVAAVVLILLAAITYPGADLLSLVIRLTPAPTATYPAVQGPLAWLHVEHPAGSTPYIADEQGRMVLLHGVIPGGLIDFWSGTDHSQTNPAPFYPIDPAAYEGTCPANYATVKVPPLCESDIKDMAAMGFNSIRLPLSWSLLEPQRGQFDQRYVDRIAQVVGWAKAAGMYVIIDMHQNAYSRYVGRSAPPPLPGGALTDLWYNSGAPAWATITDGFPSENYLQQRELNPAVFEAESNFWYNRDGIQSEYIATIAMLARRFKDESAVIGYSLFNEPMPGWNLPPGFEDLLLFPFYRRVIDAVTGVHDGLPCPTQVFMPAVCGFPDAGVHDLRQLFFMETGLIREITDFPTHLGLPVSSYPNLVLSIHPYTHGYTPDALFLGQTPDKATYPWGGYDQTYSLAEREARAINAALFVAEFGNDPKWDPLILTNELAEQERHRVGFAFWTWQENCAIGGNSWGMYNPVDCVHNLADARPASGCLRTAREQLLARVYPVASADPNLTYHYDASTGAFTLRATGHIGEPSTVVVIPSLVTGPVNVSGAVAGEPVIADVPNGRTVTVYPGAGEFTITVGAAPFDQGVACAVTN
jgi:endoglycosylceramidase